MSTIGKIAKSKPFVAKGFKGWSAKFPKEFIEICKMNQEELKRYVVAKLQEKYDNVEVSDGYVYARGSDVAVTAHLDTVHKETVKSYYGFKTDDKKHAITSPQGIGGDDRCGVYMILEMIKHLHPTIIFCEDEEIGGIGSGKFIHAKPFDELSDMKFIIELDRANANDLVFYDDENYEFHTWCEDVTGYKENWGSFSDISHFCPAYGISGVNISCGYYNAHTLNEYVVLEEMEMSLSMAMTMILASKDVEQFKYVEYKYSKYKYVYDYGDLMTNVASESVDGVCVGMTIYYYPKDGIREQEVFITGVSKEDCWYQFFLDNPTVCFNDITDWEVW